MKNTIKIAKSRILLKELAIEDSAAYFTLIKKNRAHMNKFGTMTETQYKTVEEVAKSIVNPPNPRKLRFGVWNGTTLIGMVALIKTK